MMKTARTGSEVCRIHWISYGVKYGLRTGVQDKTGEVFVIVVTDVDEDSRVRVTELLVTGSFVGELEVVVVDNRVGNVQSLCTNGMYSGIKQEQFNGFTDRST